MWQPPEGPRRPPVLARAAACLPLFCALVAVTLLACLSSPSPAAALDVRALGQRLPVAGGRLAPGPVARAVALPAPLRNAAIPAAQTHPFPIPPPAALSAPGQPFSHLPRNALWLAPLLLAVCAVALALRPRPHRGVVSPAWHTVAAAGKGTPPATAAPRPAPATGPWRRDERDGTEVSAAFVEEVEQAVAQRMRHLSRQEKAKAAAIRVALQEMGVVLSDQRRVWHITGMWREAEGDVPAPGPVREYARAAVAEREAHRQRRDFAAADRVAVELLRRGVEVDDRAKAWAYRPWRPAPEESGEVVPATAASVEALLIERDIHRLCRRFQESDDVEAQLMRRGIRLDRDRRVWFGARGWSRLPHDTAADGSLFATRLAEEVVALLAERDQHMAAGSWEQTEEVEETLEGKGIVWDDTGKMWAVGETWRRDASDLVGSGTEEDAALADQVQQALEVRAAHLAQDESDKAARIAKRLQRKGILFSDTWRVWARRPDPGHPHVATSPLWRRNAADVVVGKDDEVRGIEVERLLNARDVHRARGQFSEASVIEKTLDADGVKYDDVNRTWGLNLWTPHDDAATAALVGEKPQLAAEITAALAKREAHRLEGDYAAADRLQRELFQRGLRLGDRAKVWSLNTSPWQRTATDRQPLEGTGVTEAEVLAVLEARDQHRAGGRYAEADALQEQLYRQGVVVEDSTRQWRMKLPKTPLDEAVAQALAERDVHLIHRRYREAEALGAEVEAKGIVLRNGRLPLAVKPWVRAKPVPANSPKAKLAAKVDQWLVEREVLRAQRKFEDADALRTKLRDLGVVLNEEDQTWFFR